MLEKVVFTIVLAYLLIIQLFNARLVKSMIEALGRTRVYEETIKSAWGLSLLLLALVFLFQVPPEAIGLGFMPPDGDERAWKYLFISNIVISCLIAVYILVKKSSAFRTKLRPFYGLEIERLLLPRTRDEARAWKAVSFTAGVTEEFIFRGVLLYTISLYANVPDVTLALIGGGLFGLAHSYQGAHGVVTTGLFGFLFGYLYLATGTLWPLIIIHVLLDLIAGPIYVTDAKTD